MIPLRRTTLKMQHHIIANETGNKMEAGNRVRILLLGFVLMPSSNCEVAARFFRGFRS